MRGEGLSSSLRTLPGRAWRWALLEEGSTRPTALMRIGLGLMLWLRLADRFLIHADSSPRDVLLAVIFHLATLGTVLGAFTRLSTALVALLSFGGFAWMGPVWGAPGWGSHNIHLLVCSTMLLALCPAGRSLSLDRWWALKRAERGGPPPPSERAPLWSVRLLGVLVCTVYLSTALDKTGEVWLSGHRLQAVIAEHYTGSALLDDPLYEGLIMVAAIGVWLLELVLVGGLLFRRTRLPLAMAGVLLHGGFSILFRVFTFSANMILLYLPLFPPAQVDAALTRLCPPGLPAESAVGPASVATRAGRGLLVLGTLVALLVAGPRLLQGIEATVLRPAKADRDDRARIEREELQKWPR